MTDTAQKLHALRLEMEKLGIDGFYIPRADEFQGEYVPASNDRLKWITGFTGSAGSAVVLRDSAAFFTDGRYTIQAIDQVDADHIQIYSTAENQTPTPTLSPLGWIERNLGAGQVFGINAWLHTPSEVARINTAVERAGAQLKLIDTNPLDLAWGKARPAAPVEPVTIHPLQYAGVASEEKRKTVASLLAEKNVDALAVTTPEDICWLLNVRGGDVPCTPFALSYALVNKDGTVDWYIDLDKVDDAVKNWVGGDVRIHPLDDFLTQLETLGQRNRMVWADPAAAPVIVHNTIKETGGSVYADKNPLQLMKSKKNAVEIQGSINAHIRDGAAITRFLAALSGQGDAAKHDEISASDLLHDIRAEDPLFKGPSFDTISGSGGNGAIVHYRSTPETNQPLLSGPVYLVDSGGQYLDGTTDITRTIAVDTPNEEMRENFTRVLKGHIAVATSVFPEGTTGHVLDAKARAPLQEAGLDFAHGTGHGVGSYLSVHEGPCNISPLAKTVALEPGMILSNEPGYYKTGVYGIRLENLVTVIDTGKVNEDGKKMLAFKTLTFAPFDRNMIEPSLFTDAELKWLNDYHAEVRKLILPLVEKKDAKAAAFLIQATEPIYKPAHPVNGKKVTPPGI